METSANRTKFGRFILPAVVLFSLIFQACSPGGKLARNPKTVEAKVKEAYAEWKGTTYKLGGQSKKGVDCSAFLQAVYKDKFNVKLPRTTDQQMKIGKAIPKNKKLLPGDLVFFKTGKKQYHAGIVVRDNTFVHASTSRGVTTDQLDTKYWRKVFLKARRVLY